MRIEEIKENLRISKYTGWDPEKSTYENDVSYLLSVIEQTEKALTYYAEEPYLTSIGYAIQAVETLKAIRGN